MAATCGLEPVVAANTKFAVEFYHQIKDKPGNIFISPASISAALTLCYLGAKQETADEMKQAMKIEDIDNIHQKFGDLLTMIKGSGEYKLSVANRLFGAEKYTFLKEYLDNSLKFHRADLARVNFSNDEKAREIINKWVEGETEGKIIDLIPSGMLNSLTKMVLVNAIYFKGNWKNKFDAKATRNGKFKVTESSEKDVEIMNQSEKFLFGFDMDARCQLLGMPYAGDDLCMFVILPVMGATLTDVESHLSAEFLKKLIEGAHKQEVMVSLPKFKFELTTELNDILAKMGIRKLFAEREADLSGMDGSHELFVSKAIHKAFIEVNEEGTEAAAATGMAIATYCMPPEFRADQPFIFFIRDNRTNTILFLGRVTDPTL